jgi:inositol transport system substrate-binding protein
MTSAVAQKIGVSLSAFEHQFLVKIRQAMEEKAKELGVQIQFVEAQGDIGKQLNQIQTFISQGMDAIIVNPVDTTASPEDDQVCHRCQNAFGLRQPSAG